jgi:uncharacterized protein (TIGR00251 family)
VLSNVFKEVNGDLEFSVYLTPGAKKEEITAIVDGIVKVSVHAKPTENQANIALVEFLSDVFEIAKSRVVIVKGHKSRNKLVRLRDYKYSNVAGRVDFTSLIARLIL